jgi:hypothetical protein
LRVFPLKAEVHPHSKPKITLHSLFTALQHNKMLKSLHFSGHARLQLTADEEKQMAVLVKKNYALERIPNIDLKDRAREVGTILRLNGAGRRYLVEDRSSFSKGVEVLSRVNNDIKCIFLPLLENPRLCDRSAVEMITAGESNGSSNPTTSGGGGGKREHSSAQISKESRRILVVSIPLPERDRRHLIQPVYSNSSPSLAT